jgi:hypothetical protein
VAVGEAFTAEEAYAGAKALPVQRLCRSRSVAIETGFAVEKALAIQKAFAIQMALAFEGVVAVEKAFVTVKRCWRLKKVCRPQSAGCRSVRPKRRLVRKALGETCPVQEVLAVEEGLCPIWRLGRLWANDSPFMKCWRLRK